MANLDLNLPLGVPSAHKNYTKYKYHQKSTTYAVKKLTEVKSGGDELHVSLLQDVLDNLPRIETRKTAPYDIVGIITLRPSCR